MANNNHSQPKCFICNGMAETKLSYKLDEQVRVSAPLCWECYYAISSAGGTDEELCDLYAATNIVATWLRRKIGKPEADKFIWETIERCSKT